MDFGNVYCVGIIGVLGVGKLIVIEVLGMYLIECGYWVVVLVVDLLLICMGGLIFGDKIWMVWLVVYLNVYIWLFLMLGMLGGVMRVIWEMVVLLEVVGFDVILIEIVGVG